MTPYSFYQDSKGGRAFVFRRELMREKIGEQICSLIFLLPLIMLWHLSFALSVFYEVSRKAYPQSEDFKFILPSKPGMPNIKLKVPARNALPACMAGAAK